jgi:hypothetical protein
VERKNPWFSIAGRSYSLEGLSIERNLAREHRVDWIFGNDVIRQCEFAAFKPATSVSALFVHKNLGMPKHLKVAWNPGTKEWFCTTCGRASEHASAHEAQVELEEHECRIPSIEVSGNAPGTKTMRLMKKSYKIAPKPARDRSD